MTGQLLHVGSVGQNATVNVVYGTQTDTQVGQGNIRISGSETSQLLQLLGDLRAQADTASAVDKKVYAEIVQASATIESELKLPEGADRSRLAKAAKVLEHFKSVATIAGAIEKSPRFSGLF